MLLALLLVSQAGGEWVEISQQHYFKPVHHALNVARVTEKPPNRVYINNSLPDYGWNRDTYRSDAGSTTHTRRGQEIMEYDDSKYVNRKETVNPGGYVTENIFDGSDHASSSKFTTNQRKESHDYRTATKMPNRKVDNHEFTNMKHTTYKAVTDGREDSTENHRFVTNEGGFKNRFPSNSLRRIYIINTNDHIQPGGQIMNNKSIEVLNLSDLEYSTENEPPFTDNPNYDKLNYYQRNRASTEIPTKISPMEFPVPQQDKSQKANNVVENEGNKFPRHNSNQTQITRSTEKTIIEDHTKVINSDTVTDVVVSKPVLIRTESAFKDHAFPVIGKVKRVQVMRNITSPRNITKLVNHIDGSSKAPEPELETIDSLGSSNFEDVIRKKSSEEGNLLAKHRNKTLENKFRTEHIKAPDPEEAMIQEILRESGEHLDENDNNFSFKGIVRKVKPKIVSTSSHKISNISKNIEPELFTSEEIAINKSKNPGIGEASVKREKLPVSATEINTHVYRTNTNADFGSFEHYDPITEKDPKFMSKKTDYKEENAVNNSKITSNIPKETIYHDTASNSSNYLKHEQDVKEYNSDTDEPLKSLPTTSHTDNGEETYKRTANVDRTEDSSVENLIKFLKVVTETISRNTRRSFKSKVQYLQDLKNTVMANIEARIDTLFPDDDDDLVVPGRRSARGAHAAAAARGHVEFPSSESALMTISFLTFAVFLIKLVLQVIHTYKNKTMMVPAVMAAVGRSARFFNQHRAKN